MVSEQSRIEQIRRYNNVPEVCSLLNTKRHPDKTTARYREFDDLKAVEVFNEHGWFIKEYQQVKPHKSDNLVYGHYLAKLENPSLPTTREGKAQILMQSARNGLKEFMMDLGFFRFVCSNGLVIGESFFTPLAFKHVGNDATETLDAAVKAVAGAADRLSNCIEKFQTTILTPADAISFAKEAAGLRMNGDKYAIEPRDLLSVRRSADDANSLWQVFNRVQENLVKADYLYGTTKDGRSRKLKSVTAITANVELNKGLWDLASQYSARFDA